MSLLLFVFCTAQCVCVCERSETFEDHIRILGENWYLVTISRWLNYPLVVTILEFISFPSEPLKRRADQLNPGFPDCNVSTSLQLNENFFPLIPMFLDGRLSLPHAHALLCVFAPLACFFWLLVLILSVVDLILPCYALCRCFHLHPSEPRPIGVQRSAGQSATGNRRACGSFQGSQAGAFGRVSLSSQHDWHVVCQRNASFFALIDAVIFARAAVHLLLL